MYVCMCDCGVAAFWNDLNFNITVIYRKSNMAVVLVGVVELADTILLLFFIL